MSSTETENIPAFQLFHFVPEFFFPKSMTLKMRESTAILSYLGKYQNHKEKLIYFTLKHVKPGQNFESNML